MTGVLHIVLARKPIEGTIAENCLKHGCGALNIDGCRIGTGSDRTSGGKSGDKCGLYEDGFHGDRQERPTGGRFPANVIHDGSEEVLKNFPFALGSHSQTRNNPTNHRVFPEGFGHRPVGVNMVGFGDTGTASRFFKQVDEYEVEDGRG